ncbi:MAG: cation transporter [Bacteroidetes bacterium]|nr:cation transporter [Bacteroidota bacterium]
MKSIIIAIGLFFIVQAKAQTTIKTDSFQVKGNCEECKERIENAADIKGVKNANWNEKTKMLVITYDSKKTELDKIELAVSKSGHETTHHAADLKAYNGLPKCCKYETTHCDKK